MIKNFLSSVEGCRFNSSFKFLFFCYCRNKDPFNGSQTSATDVYNKRKHAKQQRDIFVGSALLFIQKKFRDKSICFESIPRKAEQAACLIFFRSRN